MWRFRRATAPIAITRSRRSIWCRCCRGPRWAASAATAKLRSARVTPSSNSSPGWPTRRWRLLFPLSAVGAGLFGLGLLFTLLLVASVIDAETYTIPDELTLPGTLLGLVFGVVNFRRGLVGAAVFAEAPARRLDGCGRAGHHQLAGRLGAEALSRAAVPGAAAGLPADRAGFVRRAAARRFVRQLVGGGGGRAGAGRGVCLAQCRVTPGHSRSRTADPGRFTAGPGASSARAARCR